MPPYGLGNTESIHLPLKNGNILKKVYDLNLKIYSFGLKKNFKEEKSVGLDHCAVS